ncbi:MAG: DinB family protein [bacterium]|nr:DinB family protein [bacterium]
MTGHIINNLLEIKNLLNGLNADQYNRKLEILSEASIGQHVRHILEFYQCLFKGKESKIVNYDARQRDLMLETNLQFATNTIEEIVIALKEVKCDFTVTFVADYSVIENQNATNIQSSFYRELAYNLEHSIHHQALIKVAITEMELTSLVKDNFGYAPSTIRHIKVCAQ